jgi:predicted nucleic acid-binding Zn ribbon protein
MPKVCLECGEPLKGRIDKKFCSDYCRNTYNNKQNRDETNYMRAINRALRKNRKILSEFLSNKDDKPKKIKKETLLKKGFRFDLFTSIYSTKNDTTYYFCYDLGYLPIENDYVLIVKKEVN